MARLLFFDVDGTLVCHDRGISDIPETVKKELKRLQDQGDYLFIASGRPYAFIDSSMKNAGFDGFVLCNGAQVIYHGETIYAQTLDNDDCHDLIALLKELKTEYILETKHHSYLNPRFKVLDEFFKRCKVDEDMIIYDFDEEEKIKDTLKMEVNASFNIKDTIESFIKDRFAYDSHGTENAYEIYSRTVSKATGIEVLMDKLHVKKEDTYAFGDGLNDIEMIKFVGTGVAMGNGEEKLKEVADVICESVEEDGLAKAISRYVK